MGDDEGKMGGIIPSLEENLESNSFQWVDENVQASLKRYWGKRGSNRQQVYNAICEHYHIENVSFNTMRYYVSAYLYAEK